MVGSNGMEKLLRQLRRDHPSLLFKAGDQFCWSPKAGEIVYARHAAAVRTAPWSLLHEVGHALLGHTGYDSDVALVSLESTAWEKAKEIGQQYGYEIDEDYIQDCMDTYRDWLHQRSACPTCDSRSLQQDDRHYKCFNCGQTWTVSSSRFCRPYRKKSAGSLVTSHRAGNKPQKFI